MTKDYNDKELFDKIHWLIDNMNMINSSSNIYIKVCVLINNNNILIN